MRLQSEIEKIKTKLRDFQSSGAAYCSCTGVPIFSICPTRMDGASWEPTPADLKKGHELRKASKGEICATCGKPYRPGSEKNTAILILPPGMPRGDKNTVIGSESGWKRRDAR